MPSISTDCKLSKYHSQNLSHLQTITQNGEKIPRLTL